MKKKGDKQERGEHRDNRIDRAEMCVLCAADAVLPTRGVILLSTRMYKQHGYDWATQSPCLRAAIVDSPDGAVSSLAFWLCK